MRQDSWCNSSPQADSRQAWGLVQAVGAAIVLTALSIPLHWLCWKLAPWPWGSVWFWSLISLIAVFLILRRAGRRCGRAVIGLGAALTLGATAYLLPLRVEMIIASGMFWCVIARTTYFHRSATQILTDVVCASLAVGTASWSIENGHSPWFSVWLLMLVQAGAGIVAAPQKPRPMQRPPANRFDAAHAAAESALQRLIAREG